MKVHYREDVGSLLYCKKPPFWNLQITQDPDIVTCSVCLKRLSFEMRAKATKAKFGESIEVIEGDKTPLVLENELLKVRLLKTMDELDMAKRCVNKAMAVPDYDSAVRMVQNELVPYICKYQRKVK